MLADPETSFHLQKQGEPEFSQILYSVSEETDLLKVGRRRRNRFHLTTLLPSQLAKSCTGQDTMEESHSSIVTITGSASSGGHLQHTDGSWTLPVCHVEDSKWPAAYRLSICSQSLLNCQFHPSAFNNFMSKN